MGGGTASRNRKQVKKLQSMKEEQKIKELNANPKAKKNGNWMKKKS